MKKLDNTFVPWHVLSLNMQTLLNSLHPAFEKIARTGKWWEEGIGWCEEHHHVARLRTDKLSDNDIEIITAMRNMKNGGWIIGCRPIGRPIETSECKSCGLKIFGARCNHVRKVSSLELIYSPTAYIQIEIVPSVEVRFIFTDNCIRAQCRHFDPKADKKCTINKDAGMETMKPCAWNENPEDCVKI
jgi:hypothetical protein